MSLSSSPPEVLPLPHRNQPLTQGPVHIIYYLHGSLPAKQETELRQAYEADLEQLQRRLDSGRLGAVPGVDEHPYLKMERARLRELHQRRFDAQLDAAAPGLLVNLTKPGVRQELIGQWKLLERAREVLLHAVSVMPNHVHVLASHPDPFERRSLLPVLEKHKRATSRTINTRFQRKGKRLWASKAFERAVRPGTFNKIFWEVLHNPVRIGLSSSPSAYPGNYWQPALQWSEK